MGGLRSLANPARPLCLGGIPSQSPFRGGLSGNGMLPVFLQHLPPPVGACGERNYGLFFPAFWARGPPQTQGGIPTLLPQLAFDSFFPSKTAGVTQRHIWRPMTAPRKLATFQLKRALPQPPLYPVKPETTLKSSLLFNQKNGSFRLPRIRGSLIERSKAPNWWLGSSPCRGA